MPSNSLSSSFSANGKSTHPEKATLVIKKKPRDETLTCYVNPTEYSIQRTNNWEKARTTGQDVPQFNFNGGGETKLALELLFDTSLDEKGEKDVRRRYTDKLWSALYIDQNNKNPRTHKAEPPHVLFSWGKTWSFEAVITSLNQKFTLFLEDGTPIRSIVSVSLTQVVDNRYFSRQNPTSGGTPGDIHIVREGDRLDLIAAERYNKPMLWRYIAEHNDIENPRKLIPGMHLIIPPLP